MIIKIVLIMWVLYFVIGYIRKKYCAKCTPKDLMRHMIGDYTMLESILFTIGGFYMSLTWIISIITVIWLIIKYL